MTGRITCDTCIQRRDGQYIVTYRVKGGGVGSALSDVSVPEGKDVAVLDGRVVRGDQ